MLCSARWLIMLIMEILHSEGMRARRAIKPASSTLRRLGRERPSSMKERVASWPLAVEPQSRQTLWAP